MLAEDLGHLHNRDLGVLSMTAQHVLFRLTDKECYRELSVLQTMADSNTKSKIIGNVKSDIP